MENKIVSPNPHIHSKASTASLMRDVIIALAPAMAVSVLVYGWSALLLLVLGAGFCVLLEWAIAKWMMRKPQLSCPSAAALTGLLLALNLPPSTPWWTVLIGSIVAIGVAKMSFGGMGQNVFNPAITGRVFLLVSFPQQMTNWDIPKGFIGGFDAVSGPTLLSQAKLSGAASVADLDIFRTFLLNPGGSLGEISGLALMVGFIYLLCRKVVRPWITLSIFATVAVISSIFHLCNPELYTGPLFNLVTGGLILGACFMATDYVTSPMSDWGGVVFGVGLGLIVMMIRYFGSYPEGVSFSILIMNMTVPLIDRAFHRKKFGYGRA